MDLGIAGNLYLNVSILFILTGFKWVLKNKADATHTQKTHLCTGKLKLEH